MPSYNSNTYALNLMNMLKRMTMTYQSQHKVLALRSQDKKISETGKATPTKIGLHAFQINLNMHEYIVMVLT